MKKFFLVAMMACAAVAANAQWWVGGELGYTYKTSKTKDVDDKVVNHNFNIAPEVGYNLNETWSVAAALGYNYDGNSDLNTNTFYIKPYVRYNVVDFGPVTFFLDGALNYKYTQGNIDNEGAVVKEKAHGFGIGVLPGIAVAASDKIGFVAHFGELGWNMTSWKPDVAGSKAHNTNSIGFDFSSYNVNFGVYYNF